MLEGDGHLVLTDFGLARHLPEGTTLLTCDETLTACGTREYRAPEMIMGWKYDFAVDCWSFGLFLYMMHFGKVSNTSPVDNLFKVCKPLPAPIRI